MKTIENIKTSRVTLSIKHSLKKNSGYVILALIITVITSILALITPLLYTVLFNEAIPDRNIQLLFWILAGMIVIPLAESLTNSVQYYVRSYIGEKVTSGLRKDLFQHAVNISLKYSQEINTPQIVFHLTKDAGQIGTFFSQTIIPVISNSVMIVGLFATMLILDWRLGLLAMLVLPPSVLLSKKIGQASSKLDRKQKAHLEEGDWFLHEVFNNLKLVRALGGTILETKKWNNWLSKLWSIQSKTLVVHNFNRNLLGQLINNVITGAVLGIGAYLIIAGNIAVGELVAFIAYLPRAYGTLRSIMDTRIGLDRIKVTIERVEALFLLKLEKDLFGQKILNKKNSYSIEFVNVSFQYRDDGEILKDLSFKVCENEMVAIVGPSGSGKSTIFELLMGYAVPKSGEIKIDNVNIRELSIESYRDSISIVPQDPALWDSTILKNIMYPNDNGNPNPKEINDITELLDSLELNTLITSNSAGLNINVGKQGSQLSGGERQRIAIARTLYRDRPILLIDEATSALDAITEKKVRDLLLMYKNNRTSLIIAHRLSTIMNADRIFFLRDGKIIESGTPYELLEMKGSFFEFYKAQSLEKTT